MKIVIDIGYNLCVRLFENEENTLSDMRAACDAIRNGELLPEECEKCRPEQNTFTNLIFFLQKETGIISEDVIIRESTGLSNATATIIEMEKERGNA